MRNIGNYWYGDLLGEVQGSAPAQLGTEAVTSLPGSTAVVVDATVSRGGSGGLNECRATTPIGVNSTSVLPTLTQPVSDTSKTEARVKRNDITTSTHC